MGAGLRPQTRHAACGGHAVLSLESAHSTRVSYVTTISEFGIQFSDTQRLYNIRVYHTHGPAANTLNGQRNAAAIAPQWCANVEMRRPARPLSRPRERACSRTLVRWLVAVRVWVCDRVRWDWEWGRNRTARRWWRERARAERGEAREISDRLIGLIGLPVSLFVRLAEKANSRDVCERFVHCPLGEIDLTCDN